MSKLEENQKVLQASEHESKEQIGVLSWLSGGVFEGYILSRLFDVWIYGTVPQWHDPENYGKIFLCITIPVFILSLLAGKLVNAVSGAITGKLWKLAERIPSYSRK